jgi:hypothetical protein
MGGGDVFGVGEAIGATAQAAGQVVVRAIDEISEVIDSLDRPWLNYEISWKQGKQFHTMRLNVSNLTIIITLSVCVMVYIAIKWHMNDKDGSTKLLELLRPLWSGMQKFGAGAGALGAGAVPSIAEAISKAPAATSKAMDLISAPTDTIGKMFGKWTIDKEKYKEIHGSLPEGMENE